MTTRSPGRLSHDSASAQVPSHHPCGKDAQDLCGPGTLRALRASHSRKPSHQFWSRAPLGIGRLRADSGWVLLLLLSPHLPLSLVSCHKVDVPLYRVIFIPHQGNSVAWQRWRGVLQQSGFPSLESTRCLCCHPPSCSQISGGSGSYQLLLQRSC